MSHATCCNPIEPKSKAALLTTKRTTTSRIPTFQHSNRLVDLHLKEAIMAAENERQKDTKLVDNIRIAVGTRMRSVSIEKRGEFIKQTFQRCDTSHTNTLMAAEFHAALRSLTDVGVFVEHRNIERLIQMFDKDGDGSINFDEFLGMLMDPADMVAVTTGGGGDLPAATNTHPKDTVEGVGDGRESEADDVEIEAVL